MCSCASCTYTDSFHSKGFDKWPRGKPANGQSARDYAAHWRHCNAMRPYKSPENLGDGTSFYGTPAGMTKAQVREVLRASFGLTVSTSNYGKVKV